MKIVIIGGGAFGTAIANSLKKENEILLFTRSVVDVEKINATRRNERYFPNKVLSKQIRATNDLIDFKGAEIIFICIPSHSVVEFIKQLELDSKAILVNGAKGFSENGELIPEALSHHLSNEICSLKGPSFADELIYELPTSFTLASTSVRQYDKITAIFRRDLIIFDYTNDIFGIETLSIIKNIYAIIIGIVDASFNSANVRFMLLTKALNEIKRIAELLSIPFETLFRYGGIGDFGLTALNDLSRNRTLGLLIGKGFFGENLSNTIVLEGVRAVGNIISTLPKANHFQFPLLTTLSKLLKNEIDVNSFVNKIVYK